MDFGSQYNVRSPAVKRLMKEAWEMREPTEDFSAAPVGDNLFEWHFTIRGASDSDFDGGVYHGRITFPTEYPMKPPNILLFTPNGRFETNKKICLSISGHHPETWQPSWSVRTALLALIAFMPTPGNSTVGSLDYTKEERQSLARRSRSWECRECGNILKLLASVDKNGGSSYSDKNAERETEAENPVNITEVDPPPVPACSIETVQKEAEIPMLNSSNNVSSSKVPDNKSCSSETTPVSQTFDSPLTSFLNHNQLETISSNISNSKVTISIILVLIALILYRRIFLSY